MPHSLSLIRVLFVVLAIFFATAYMISGVSPEDSSYYIRVGGGVAAGASISLAIIVLDLFFKRFRLLTLNTTTLGLLFGYLLGKAVNLVIANGFALLSISLSMATVEFVQMSVFLCSIYIGIIATLKASDEIAVSIPFIRLHPLEQKRKSLIVDVTALLDPRLIDLAATGVFDEAMIIPRHLIKELYDQLESSDEASRYKARRGIETAKKLESFPSLGLRYTESDFTDAKDHLSKLVKLARLSHADILTADFSKVQQPSVEGVKLINMHALSNALKPLAQMGEMLNIKIQRYGKEPRQGVGYLDDGTMVVINGGADFIGETVRAQVLSVKHTTSGRMIFCNAVDGDISLEDDASALPEEECSSTSAKNYFAL